MASLAMAGVTLASRLGFDPGFPWSGWAPDVRENLK